jgi:hypothetical protein
MIARLNVNHVNGNPLFCQHNPDPVAVVIPGVREKCHGGTLVGGYAHM